MLKPNLNSLVKHEINFYVKTNNGQNNFKNKRKWNPNESDNFNDK